MRRLLASIEGSSALDRVAGVMRRVMDATVGRGRAGPALHGVWFGHPLHPAVVQVPVGCWTSAAILDAMPDRDTVGYRRAATTLLGVGTAAALPAVATGGADYTTLSPAQRRVAVVHSAANATAVALFTASFLARASGAHRAGRALSFAGLGAAGAGAYLGGHLAFAQGAGVEPGAVPLEAAANVEELQTAAW